VGVIYPENIIYDICSRVLSPEPLDIFYIITSHKQGISKIDIQREYNRQLGKKEDSSQSRHLVSDAVSLLVGTTFVDFYRERSALLYYVTENGEVAADLMGQLFLDKPDLLRASKIVSKAMQSPLEEV